MKKALRSFVIWWNAPLSEYQSRSFTVEGALRINWSWSSLNVDENWKKLAWVLNEVFCSYPCQQLMVVWLHFSHILHCYFLFCPRITSIILGTRKMHDALMYGSWYVSPSCLLSLFERHKFIKIWEVSRPTILVRIRVDIDARSQATMSCSSCSWRKKSRLILLAWEFSSFLNLWKIRGLFKKIESWRPRFGRKNPLLLDEKIVII